MRAVNCLVTSRAPASASRQRTGVIPSSDENLPGSELLLEMTLKAEIRVALHEHLIIDRPMRIVAGRAALPNSFMLENERPTLRDMAGPAGIDLGSERERVSFDRITFVRIVTIRATDLPLAYRMMMRKTEFPAHIQMTLKTNFWRPGRIDNSSMCAT
jgi:hypothetical protein